MLTIIGILLYFVPTIVALVRKRPKPGATIAVNVLLGWTVIGWAVALWMAFQTPADEDSSRTRTVTPLETGETLTAKGAGGTMTFDGRDIRITRKGGLSLLIHGLAGEKVIPIYSVQAVQLRQAKFGVRGYLQLTVMGGIENRGGAIGAASDENSVLFDVADQPAFDRLAGVLREAIHTARQPAPAQVAASSHADEIEKLAGLRDRGILTEDEFAAKKARILDQ